jgi:hypothetical protein
MRKALTIKAVAVFATIYGCASKPPPAEALQPVAESAAQQRRAADLECPAATTEVLRQATIEEARTTGWYETPHRAAYSTAVSGCGKRATYPVACDERQKSVCIPGKIQN